MAMPGGPEVTSPVTVWGLRRGTEFGGVGAIELHDDAVVLDAHARAPGVQDGRVELSLAELDGVRFASAEVGSAGLLTLFVQGGDVFEVSGPARLAGVARGIALRACILPEATLRLHALGSQRGRPGSDHDRFFAPLLRARRRAELASSPEQQIGAFDAAELAGIYRRVMAELAAERFPDEPPDRRALEAELLDLAEGLLASLDALGAAAEGARRGPEDTRFVRWREWATAVGGAFEHADRFWLAALPPLTDSRGRSGRFWRGILRRLSGGHSTPGGAALLAHALGAALTAPAAAQHVVLRVPAVPAESLLARGFDVVERRPDGALVVAGPAERARLTTLGWTALEVETPSSGRRRAAAGDVRAAAAPVATTVYRPYDDERRGVRAFLDSLAAAHPATVRTLTLGTTFEGRPIVGVKLGAADDSPSRPNVLFMATYHAREWAATEMALRLIRCLADGGTSAPFATRCPGITQAQVARALAGLDIWVVPVVNADGYEYTFQSVDTRLWRKNRRPNGDGSVGVDLNRNHSARWGYDNLGSSPVPASEVFRGPSPVSEAETQAIEAFHANQRPVASVSWHSYSGLLLYPPGFRSGLVPQDLGVYRAIAGTDQQPVVRDHLPNSGIDYYHPGPGWHLYPTNGEYTDFASARYGTLAFTPELSSGYENGTYYGFEFPDDEGRLQQLFADNMPFVARVLDAAFDPLVYSLGAEPRGELIALESVAPVVRVRVPTAGASSAGPRVTARFGAGQGSPQTVPVLPDDSTDLGVYTRRFRSSPLSARPAEITVEAGARTARFTVLAASGAEGGAADAGWAASGFAAQQDARAVAGGSVWSGSAQQTLRSPVVRVGTGVDTLSLIFWTQQSTFLFVPEQAGEVRVSRDSGRTFVREAIVAASAPLFYPEEVRVADVAGRFVQVEFAPQEMIWRLDEIALVAHSPPAAPGATNITDAAIAFSQNPVRVGGTVYVTVPAGVVGGEIAVYDFAGRQLWRSRITGDSPGRDPDTVVVPWELGSAGVANGAYVVVVRTASGRSARRTLFVAR